MPSVLSVPCLASDRNMQSGTLQQACGLSDKNIRHGLTLRESTCQSGQYKAFSCAQAKKDLTLPLVGSATYWPDQCWE